MTKFDPIEEFKAYQAHPDNVEMGSIENNKKRISNKERCDGSRLD